MKHSHIECLCGFVGLPQAFHLVVDGFGDGSLQILRGIVDSELPGAEAAPVGIQVRERSHDKTAPRPRYSIRDRDMAQISNLLSKAGIGHGFERAHGIQIGWIRYRFE